MKIILLSALLFLSGAIVLSQKVKKEGETIKYFRPAIYLEPIARTYNIRVVEKLTEADGSVSEHDYIAKGGIGGQGREYSFPLGSLVGFNYTAKADTTLGLDTTSQLFIKADKTNIISSKPISQNITDAAGKVTGVRWSYQTTIYIPLSFQFLSEKNETIIEHTDSFELRTYTYPSNYSKQAQTTFTSKDALQASFNTNKHEYLKEIRAKYISDWSVVARKIIKHTFIDDEDLFSVDFTTIKGKKGEFDDIDLLVERMKIQFEIIRENFKLGNKVNWHSEAIHAEFSAIALGFQKMIESEAANVDANQPLRFDHEGFSGVCKNFLWCKFFMGEFDFVIERSNYFIEQENKRASANLIPGFSIFWTNLLEVSTTYKKIYAVNKTRFNWH
ncbi:MAG: hypothetical protein IPO32_00035 [Crocinitomicaceae bacterium]|nr:hypothetical protein [Crocinitomicaceae bacterium]MBK6952620.1 hypothetical protein [Crocinitomicaceae bacterium]MBK9589923.1 hypothetical protein [Crocinitomicaceae bacterium]